MSYIQKDLLDGERIIYTGKLHWFIFVPSILFALLAIFLLHLSHQYPPLGIAGAMAAVWAFLLLVKEAVIKTSTELAVTNKRVIFKKGLISRNTMELNHNKIESIHEEQGILD